NHNNFYLLMKDVFIFILYEFLPDLISVSVLCEVKLICLTCLLLSYCQTVTNLHPEAPSLLPSHTHTHTPTHTHAHTHTLQQASQPASQSLLSILYSSGKLSPQWPCMVLHLFHLKRRYLCQYPALCLRVRSLSLSIPLSLSLSLPLYSPLSLSLFTLSLSIHPLPL